MLLLIPYQWCSVTVRFPFPAAQIVWQLWQVLYTGDHSCRSTYPLVFQPLASYQAVVGHVALAHGLSSSDFQSMRTRKNKIFYYIFRDLQGKFQKKRPALKFPTARLTMVLLDFRRALPSSSLKWTHTLHTYHEGQQKCSRPITNINSTIKKYRTNYFPESM